MLDGKDVKLTSDTLLIADHEKPLAIAGVMGGEHSGINRDTKDVLLEAAFFQPIALAGKARSYGLHTDASPRFIASASPNEAIRFKTIAASLALKPSESKLSFA